MKGYFYLINIKEMSSKNPRRFLVPSKEEIEKLKLGSLVKVILKKEKVANEEPAEEFLRVKIIKKDLCNYVGILDEDSHIVKELKKGTIINLEECNITNASVSENSVKYESKSAIISKRAMENCEINWVVRTTPLNNNDSGWQLFYGDEEYEYLNKEENLYNLSLKEAFQIEPLVEYIVSSRYNSAEYNSKYNKFISI